MIIERVLSATDEVRALIDELEQALSLHYEAHQRHGLKLAAIFQPHIRFFVARMDGEAVGCGGVAMLGGFAELKRMFVRERARGRGGADALLARLEDEARGAGYAVLRLETGAEQHAALRFCTRSGFQRCAAFGDYATMDKAATATSVFMEKRLPS